ncbi:MAG: hypothetical protein AAF788_03445 [Pseudomonadota bacterium]
MRAFFIVTMLMLTSLTPTAAGEVTIEEVVIRPLGGDRYEFSVTLRHADAGWDHFADHWQVESPDGEVLGERPLTHPHVREQPFTRSTTVTIPKGMGEVVVRARDTLHGWGEETYMVQVPQN